MSNSVEDDNETEYESLREEILSGMGGEGNVINLALTATIVIFGFNLSTEHQPRVFIFFLPLFILSVAIIQITQSHLGTIQTATYIRLVCEKGTQKNWESWMSYYRERLVKEIVDPSSPKSKINSLIRRFSLNFITSFFALRNHIWIAVLSGFLCLTYALRYGLIQYGKNLESIDRHLSIDFIPLLFWLILILGYCWWIFLAVYTYITLKPSKVYSFEKKYEITLRNWITYDKKFEYLADEYDKIPSNALKELNKVKMKLGPIKQEIIDSSIEFALLFGYDKPKLKIKGETSQVLLGKIGGYLEGYEII